MISSQPGNQVVRIANTPDILGLTKTFVVAAAFLASVGAIILGHNSPEVLDIMFSTGAMLGVWRVSDVVANILNVRSYLASPTAQASGVLPQSSGTALIATAPTPNGNGAAST